MNHSPTSLREAFTPLAGVPPSLSVSELIAEQHTRVRTMSTLSSISLGLLLWYRATSHAFNLAIGVVASAALLMSTFSHTVSAPGHAVLHSVEYPQSRVEQHALQTSAKATPRVMIETNAHLLEPARRIHESYIPLAALPAAEPQDNEPTLPSMSSMSLVSFVTPIGVRSASADRLEWMHSQAFAMSPIYQHAEHSDQGLVLEISNQYYQLFAEGNASTSTVGVLQYSVGYHLSDHTLSVTYSAEPIRQTITSTRTIEIFNTLDNTIRYAHTISRSTKSQSIGVAAVRYAYSPAAFQFFGLQPMAHLSIGTGSAGIVTTIGGGATYAFDGGLHLSLEVSREQFNSYDYAHSVRTSIGCGISYRW